MIELSAATLPLAIRGQSQMLDRAHRVERPIRFLRVFRSAGLAARLYPPLTGNLIYNR